MEEETNKTPKKQRPDGLILKKVPSKRHSNKIGTLRLEILEGKDLVPLDATGKGFYMNAMIVRVGGEEASKQRSGVIKGAQSIVWGEKERPIFNFDVSSPGDVVELRIRIKEAFYMNRSFGTIRFHVQDIFPQLPTNAIDKSMWLEVENSIGSILVNVTYNPVIPDNIEVPNEINKKKLSDTSKRIAHRTLSNISLEDYIKDLQENDPQKLAPDAIVPGLRTLVSVKKKRFKDDKYDLDLAYITDRIIAMGFPAGGMEKMYRNAMEDTQNFLNEYHPKSHKVYNLCSERDYRKDKFHETAKFPFDDHNVPSVEMIWDFCKDLENWLDQSGENVGVIHCKAGKGRTGLMICAYLMYRYGKKLNLDQAFDFYAQRRTKNRKGVTISSQRRFVGYWSLCVDRFRENTWKPDRPLLMTQISLEFPPSNEIMPNFILKTGGPDNRTVYDWKEVNNLAKYKDVKKAIVFHLNPPVEVNRETKIEVFDETTRKSLFYFWFHTIFIQNYELTLNRTELDKVKNKEKYPPNFQVAVKFIPCPNGDNIEPITIPNPLQNGEIVKQTVELSSETTFEEDKEGEKGDKEDEKDEKGEKGVKEDKEDKEGTDVVLVQVIEKYESTDDTSTSKSDIISNDSSQSISYSSHTPSPKLSLESSPDLPPIPKDDLIEIDTPKTPDNVTTPKRFAHRTLANPLSLEDYRKELQNNDPQQLAADSIVPGLKTLVSVKKKRFKNDKYDLDLAYITDRIIAMGFPAEGVEKMFRNSMEDTQSFLNEYHPKSYKVYNLCSERGYRKEKFHEAIVFPFDDHNVPPIETIWKFCLDLENWMEQHENNVGVIHCKAGKGRTGLMICAYFMFRYGHKISVEEAFEFYAERRTKNKKGVTISSQKRFVRYFSSTIEDFKSNTWNPDLSLLFTRLQIENPPSDVKINFIITTGPIENRTSYDWKKCSKLPKSKGKLRIRLNKGKDLYSGSSGINAFVNLRLAKNNHLIGSKQRSKEIKGTTDFTWNEEFSFNIPDLTDFSINFRVWDKDFLGSHLLGKLSVPLEGILLPGEEKQELTSWFKLDTGDGQINLTLEYTRDQDEFQYKETKNEIIMPLHPPFLVTRETKVEVHDEISKKVMFYFWFHTKFIQNGEFVASMTDLDKVLNKDKYPQNFKLTVKFAQPDDPLYNRPSTEQLTNLNDSDESISDGKETPSKSRKKKKRL